MYDLPDVTSATDSWWAGLARAFGREGVPGVPERLDREIAMDTLWRSPELLFSQTCGYPLTHAYQGCLRVIATPIYAADDCSGPDYCSLIFVREDDPAAALGDLRGRTVAVNNPDSQSGYSALRASVAPLAEDGAFFGRVVESGGHPNSLAMVQSGEADVCAADCVTFALLARHRPAAVEGLRVLDRSPRAPGLPYVTHGGAGDDLLARLRAGLAAAIRDPDLAAARETLLIAGAEVLPDHAYQRIIDIENKAQALGYAQVA
jgi:ABC-type phosphate/phosphonate transport system substrate-binding protein